MKLNLGDKMHGFEVVRVRELSELGGNLVELKHLKTGAEVCHLDNGESNKLFAIAFETLPEDHTGVFHILEHSVLCGSDKFPVKEPFVELIKSSMNTFLNAMTFPDKTMYPVSSRNEKDFLNLTKVYLDAVFAPAILTNPDIFYQEGHHTEIAEDGTTSYKGVVFNEMKGVIGSVDEAVEIAMTDMLYPDSVYKYVSGGHPEHIPDLTYEQFIDTYKRFYHPSNSKTWLDGDVPMDEVLLLLDEYFSSYEKSDNLPVLNYQDKPESTERTAYYEIAEDESEENKVQIAWGKLAGDWRDKEKLLAADVVFDVLAGSNDAPLKRAVLEGGLCQDFTLTLFDGIAQPFCQMRAHNTELSKKEELTAVINKVLLEQLEKGLDRESLEASLNQLEFRVLEASEPQGLYRAMNSMNAWLYGGDPAMYITWKDSFASLREKLDGDYYNEVMRELLYDRDGMCTVCLLPSRTVGEEMRAREAARLEREAAARSEAENEALKELNRGLEEWHNTPDSPEALATIPTLDLSEVSAEPAFSPFKVDEADGVTVLRHEAMCGGITHLNLYFSLADYTKEELSYIAFIPMLLGELPTKNYDSITLQREIKKYTGRLNFGIDIFSERGQTEDCTPYFEVTASFLSQNREKVIALVREILTETDFSHTDKIRETFVQEENYLRQGVIMSGHTIAMTRALSHFSAGQALKETVTGFERYCTLRDTVKAFDEKAEMLEGLYSAFAARAIARKRLTVSVTSPDANTYDVSDIIGAFEMGEVPTAVKYEKANTPRFEGIKIPAQISYASVGYNLNDMNFDYSGVATVLSGILSFGALWSKVRVQGGAYGAGIQIRSNGNIACYSYRDPSAKRTLDIYAGLAADLREFCESDEAIDKYIISSIARTEPVRSHLGESVAVDAEWFCKIDEDCIRRLRRDMLECTKEKLMDWCDALSAMTEKGAVCVIGYDGVLADCEGLEIAGL